MYLRWRTKPEPEDNHIAIRSGFAFLPKELSDGSYVWLERYNIYERYYKFSRKRRGGYWELLSIEELEKLRSLK